MKHLRPLRKYFWKYRWLFLLGILFVVLTNYFRILAPQLTGYVVNTVVQSVKDTAASGGAEKNYDVLVKAIISWYGQSNYNKILLAGITLLVLALISGFFYVFNAANHYCYEPPY